MLLPQWLTASVDIVRKTVATTSIIRELLRGIIKSVKWEPTMQGGVTSILTVFLSATVVKVLVKRQSKETPSSQWSRTPFHNYMVNRQEDFTCQK